MKEIKPKKGLQARISVPGSKSHTQRALAIAALADGESKLTGALISEDTLYLVRALRNLGVKIEIGSETISVLGSGGRLQAQAKDIYLGNNGTALRFLTAMAALTSAEVTLTGLPRLLERPVGPLVDALRKLGAAIACLRRDGFPPLKIKTGILVGGQVSFSHLDSSQYISALLMVAPYARRDLEIELAGKTVSRPYIDLTISTMKDFGVAALACDSGYRVAAGQRYRGRIYAIEGDVSSASYFFLAAALTGGRVEVANLPLATLQGDLRFLDILAELGSRVERGGSSATVFGGELRRGDYEVDMGDIPDLVPTASVLAAFREGKTRITNCAHLQYKESDRLAVLVAELAKMGIAARRIETGLEIVGGRPRGAVICAHGDHRIAMAFAVAGLALPGMAIEGSEAVSKSFPGFWEELARL